MALKIYFKNHFYKDTYIEKTKQRENLKTFDWKIPWVSFFKKGVLRTFILKQNLKRGILFWKSFFFWGEKKGWFQKCVKKYVLKIIMVFFLKKAKKEKKRERDKFKSSLFLWCKKTCKYFVIFLVSSPIFMLLFGGLLSSNFFKLDIPRNL